MVCIGPTEMEPPPDGAAKKAKMQFRSVTLAVAYVWDVANVGSWARHPRLFGYIARCLSFELTLECILFVTNGGDSTHPSSVAGVREVNNESCRVEMVEVSSFENYWSATTGVNGHGKKV